VREVVPGIFHWVAIHPKIHIEVSSYWLEGAGVLIDPLVPADLGLEWFAQRPVPPVAVVLSNRHHYRDSSRFVERFGAAVHCTRAGLHEFTHGERVAGFDPGATLPGGLVAYEIGGLCPDETALHLPGASAVWFADGVVRGGPGGSLGFVPDSLMDNPLETKRVLLDAYARFLRELEFEHILLAHGGPVVGDGRAQLQEFVDSGGRTAFEL
jgi:hypothetical protein